MGGGPSRSSSRWLLKPRRSEKKEQRRFQAAVLGGTFAAVPGTQLLAGEGAACFQVSAWSGVINILKDGILSPGLK